MLRSVATVVSIGLLSACGANPSGETAAETEAAAIPEISAETVQESRDAPIEDQLIECAENKPDGITLTQRFVISGGRVKSYSDMQNYARDMCDPGQTGCALGWQDEKIAMLFVTDSGAKNTFVLDPDTLAFDKTLTTAERGTESHSGTCISAPLPSDITIE